MGRSISDCWLTPSQTATYCNTIVATSFVCIYPRHLCISYQNSKTPIYRPSLPRQCLKSTCPGRTNRIPASFFKSQTCNFQPVLRPEFKMAVESCISQDQETQRLRWHEFCTFKIRSVSSFQIAKSPSDTLRHTLYITSSKVALCLVWFVYQWPQYYLHVEVYCLLWLSSPPHARESTVYIYQW